jgi:hypothetical protein
MYVTLITIIGMGNLFGAARLRAVAGAGQPDITKMTWFQLNDEIRAQTMIMNAEKHAWRNKTIGRLCCHCAGEVCSCCVPICIGCVVSANLTRDVDEGGQPMCGLQPFEPITLTIGMVAGLLAGWGWENWYGPDQSAQKALIAQMEAAKVKKNQ